MAIDPLAILGNYFQTIVLLKGSKDDIRNEIYDLIAIDWPYHAFTRHDALHYTACA